MIPSKHLITKNLKPSLGDRERPLSSPGHLEYKFYFLDLYLNSHKKTSGVLRFWVNGAAVFESRSGRKFFDQTFPRIVMDVKECALK
jgi:hypothetical protein